MENYIVSARKYRPKTFKSVVGQKALTTTLKNAIDRKKLAQAYLFCGPRGVGKTSCARIFAKTINCMNPTEDGEACGKCESCKAIETSSSFNIVELDAASNSSVDNIRALMEEVNVPPQVGNYRVFIIDEVHMLSNQAFNAFLKTLEEPPKYVVFIMATTEKHKVIPTILSRCQIYDFKRITTADIVEHLQLVAKEENIEASPEALNVIARKADGAMRDALSIFDQVAASSLGKITYKSTIANLNVLDYDYYFSLVEAFRKGDVAEALLIFNEIQENGFDNLFFINGLASHIRDLMVAADTRTAKLLEVADEVTEKYTAQARNMPLQWYFAALKLINDADLNYRTATNKQLLVELLLIRLCQLLNPPTPPFDRVDNEQPLKMPERKNSGERKESVTAEAKTPIPQNNGVKPVAPPVAKPIAQPKPQPLKKPSTPHIEGVSTRLSDLEAQYEKNLESNKGRNKEIAPDALEKAWRSFIASNEDKGLLINAMKTGFPVPIGEEEYILEVAHPAHEQAVLTYMTPLLNFMRNELENDRFILKVKIKEGEEIKKPLPPKELFQDIISSNSSIANLARNIDAELV